MTDNDPELGLRIRLERENERLRAENLAYRSRVGDLAPELVFEVKKPKAFLRSSLRDPTFFKANRDDILAAVREGRIVDDAAGWQVPEPKGSKR